MAQPAPKRKRANTLTDGLSSTKEIEGMLKALPIDTVRNLLAEAASEDFAILDKILTHYTKLKVQLASKVVDFDYYSKDAWKAINVTYKDSRGSKEYDNAGNALRDVEDCIKTIRKGCTGLASFGTKKSGLLTLRKIGKSIAVSNGVISRELHKDFGSDTILEDTMIGIAKTLSKEERKKVLEEDGFEEKLEELEGLGQSYCIFEKMNDALAVMRGAEVDAKGNVEAYDEEDEDEDDDEDDDDEAEDEY